MKTTGCRFLPEARRTVRSFGTAAVAVAATVLAPSVSAFDGQRSGFIIGAALGAHSTDVEVSGNGFRSEGDSSGFALAFKIGMGLSDRFAVYFLLDNQFDTGDDVGFGLTGVGGSYHFRASGASPYLTAGVGLGAVSDDDIDSEDAYGGAAMFGGGYAFAWGLYLEGSLMAVSATLDPEFGSDIDYDTLSGRFMVGYNWY